MLASVRFSIICLLIFLPLVAYLFNLHAQAGHGLGLWSDSLYNDNTSTLDVPGAIIDETQEGAPRIRQASMVFGSGESAIYERSLKTHIKHGERWGYPTHFLRQDVIGRGDWSKLVFDKILYLQSIVVNEMTKPPGKRSEWVVWVDADTILINQNIPWEIFLPPSDGFQDIHLLGAKDWNGFNCGVFFIRVNDWTVNMLADVAALRSLRPEVELGYNIEQDAMVWVFNRTGYYEHILYQPLDWYNGYEYTYDTPVVKDGDMLVHFPGYKDNKYPAMGKWLDRLESEEKHLLQVPLQNTTYPYKIKKFWSRLRSAQEALHKVDDLRDEEWSDISNQAVVEHVQVTENELRHAFWEYAFKDQRVKEGISALNKALDVAEKERAAKQKAMEEEKIRNEEKKKADEEAQQKNQVHKEKAEEEKKKQEEAEKQKDAKRQKAMKAQQEARAAEEAQKIEAPAEPEKFEEKAAEENWGSNQIVRAKEEVKKEAEAKRKAKKERDEKTKKEGEATKRNQAESRGNSGEHWSRNQMERQMEKKDV